MMNDITTQQFDVPLGISQSLYSNYYLLHWSGTYLYAKLTEAKKHVTDKTESISHYGIEYSVHLVPGLTYWYLSNYQHRQYALSFRLPRDAKQGVVLIKLLNH